MKNEYESGRSMVEMLGVLAVIGVLSVAGVAAYTNAMKRYRTNEVLNEASKRAVMVAGQLLVTPNAETISLAQFGTEPVAGVTFDSSATIADGQITLRLSGDGLSELCDQMLSATGDNTVMKVTKEDCSELTFNADMSRGVTAGSDSGTNSGTYDDNAGAKECSGPSDCDAGCQQCSNGKCISKCELGEYCAQGESTSDYTCKNVTSTECPATNCPDITPCCTNGVCTMPTCPEGSFWADCGCPDGIACFDSNWHVVSSTGTCSDNTKVCSSNADCDTQNEYCQIFSSTFSCSLPDAGTCTSVGTVNTVSGKTGAAATYNGYVYSSTPMTWWAANNWCKSQSKRLVNLSDLDLSKPSGNYCLASECQDATGNTMTSDKWQVLKDTFGSDLAFWTVDSYNSCEAFEISLGGSAIGDMSRTDQSGYALCE